MLYLIFLSVKKIHLPYIYVSFTIKKSPNFLEDFCEVIMLRELQLGSQLVL